MIKQFISEQYSPISAFPRRVTAFCDVTPTGINTPGQSVIAVEVVIFLRVISLLSHQLLLTTLSECMAKTCILPRSP